MLSEKKLPGGLDSLPQVGRIRRMETATGCVRRRSERYAERGKVWARRRRMVLLLTLVAALAACRSLQPSAGNPSAEGETPSDLMQRYVHQIIFDMRDSFAAADVAGFMRHVSEGFYGGRARLEENFARTLSAAAPSSLTIEIGEVKTDGSRVTALVKWRRTPSGGREGGKGPELRGESFLVFRSSDRIALVAFEKDPLFGIEGF